jgi:UDP-N-acetylglucosamine 3-dehydrogenase
MTQDRSGTKPRVGVIGVGSMGRNHARVFSDMEGVDLVAVSDTDLETLKMIATRYHAKPYSDYKKLLADESLDAVTVAVPTRLHRQIAEEVINQGVSLLLEKPLASTVEEGQEILELAKSKGVTLGVGHVERFNPVVAMLKSNLDAGNLGNIFQITIRRFGPFPQRIMDVGIYLDLATHDIDIMYYLTGSDVQRVSAESAQLLPTKHEDLGVGLLRFSNGVIGVLIENWLSPTKVRDIVVNGERGMFVADFLSQDLFYYENDYTSSGWESLQVFRGVSEGNMTRYKLDRDEPLKLELESFVHAVMNHEPFLVSGEDGLKAMKIAQQMADCTTKNNEQDGLSEIESDFQNRSNNPVD